MKRIERPYNAAYDVHLPEQTIEGLSYDAAKHVALASSLNTRVTISTKLGEDRYWVECYKDGAFNSQWIGGE